MPDNTDTKDESTQLADDGRIDEEMAEAVGDQDDIAEIEAGDVGDSDVEAGEVEANAEDVKDEVEVESNTSVTVPEPDSDPELESSSDTESNTNLDQELETDAEPVPETEHESEPAPDLDTDPDLEPERELDADFEPEPEPEALAPETPVPDPAPETTPTPTPPRAPATIVRKPVNEPFPGYFELAASAKRVRNLFIILCIFVMLLAGALVWVGYQYIWPIVLQPTGDLKPSVELAFTPGQADEGQIPLVVDYETLQIPDLVVFYGKPAGEALALLGSGWQLERENEVTSSETSPVVRMQTIKFKPRIISVSGGDGSISINDLDKLAAYLPEATLYLSLDADNLVVEVLFACDLETIGFSAQDFEDLLVNDSFLRGVLYSAGVQPRDFTYQAPDYANTLTFDYPDAANPRVMKQSHIFSGRGANEGFPTAWAVTVSYEFMPPVVSQHEYTKADRLLYISLA